MYAEKQLNFIINRNNGELTNGETELKYECSGNIIYAFILEDDITDELIGAYWDTKAAIVYDVYNLLGDTECNVAVTLFKCNKLREIKKIKHGWYLCVCFNKI